LVLEGGWGFLNVIHVLHHLLDGTNFIQELSLDFPFIHVVIRIWHIHCDHQHPIIMRLDVKPMID